MTWPDGFTAFAEGAAQQITARAATLDSRPFSWSPTAAYTPQQRGIYIGVAPATPDEIVTLSPRPLTAHATLADTVYALQIRIRGTRDPRTAYNVRSVIRAVFLGVFPATWPNGYRIQSCEDAGGANLGPDANGRFEVTENYVFAVGEHRTHP